MQHPMPSALTQSIRQNYREAREIPINYEPHNFVANPIYEGGFQVKVHSLSPTLGLFYDYIWFANSGL